MKSTIPNWVRLNFLAIKAKRKDWSESDAKEIWQSVVWAFSQGTHDDRHNCEIWLKIEASA